MQVSKLEIIDNEGKPRIRLSAYHNLPTIEWLSHEGELCSRQYLNWDGSFDHRQYGQNGALLFAVQFDVDQEEAFIVLNRTGAELPTWLSLNAVANHFRPNGLLSFLLKWWRS